ncbi:hypothetical protein ACQ4M3_07745 [Leptolyngbya sp. AN03gr2]|uniref:hypothetical protein n=1 Tax=unclassified Leptolyngbya TaxID=2650499 RepID=UPI003D30F78E
MNTNASSLPNSPVDVKLFTGIIHLALTGCCAIFAIELHRAKGYELIGFIDEAGNVCHFACRNQAGEIIDANGKGLTTEEVSQTYLHQGHLRIEPFEAAEVEANLEEEYSLGAFVPPGYAKALPLLFSEAWWSFWEEFGRKMNVGTNSPNSSPHFQEESMRQMNVEITSKTTLT